MGEQQLTYVNHEILGESFTFLKNTYTSGGSSTLFGVVGKVIHEEMEVITIRATTRQNVSSGVSDQDRHKPACTATEAS